MYRIVANNLWKKYLLLSLTVTPHSPIKKWLPYVMYEPPTKKSRSLTVYIIHVSDNGNLASKIAITQAEGSVDYLTTYLEEEFSETSK